MHAFLSICSHVGFRVVLVLLNLGPKVARLIPFAVPVLGALGNIVALVMEIVLDIMQFLSERHFDERCVLPPMPTQALC